MVGVYEKLDSRIKCKLNRDRHGSIAHLKGNFMFCTITCIARNIFFLCFVRFIFVCIKFIANFFLILNKVKEKIYCILSPS